MIYDYWSMSIRFYSVAWLYKTTKRLSTTRVSTHCEPYGLHTSHSHFKYRTIHSLSPWLDRQEVERFRRGVVSMIKRMYFTISPSDFFISP